MMMTNSASYAFDSVPALSLPCPCCRTEYLESEDSEHYCRTCGWDSTMGWVRSHWKRFFADFSGDVVTMLDNITLPEALRLRWEGALS